MSKKKELQLFVIAHPRAPVLNESWWSLNGRLVCRTHWTVDNYAVGFSPPRYPLPVPMSVADIATAWISFRHYECPECAWEWTGAMECAADTIHWIANDKPMEIDNAEGC